MSAAPLFLPFAVGVLSWTLLEYLMHRFLGHYGRANNPFGREHKQHHATTHYFAPTGKKAAVAVPILAAAGLGLGTAVGMGTGIAFVAGISLMYIAYEVTHRRAHTHPPTGAYSRWVRRNHFHHHFRNPRANHGVTSPFWDYVFATHETPGVIRVPRRHALVWLVDAGTGEVHARFAQDYVLVGRAGGKAADSTGTPETVDQAAEPPPALAV